jgi:hypothetical protein
VRWNRCTLEYSDDNQNWTTAGTFDINGRAKKKAFSDLDSAPHKYWRVNLKGTDEESYTFGSLWDAVFWVYDEEEEENEEPKYPFRFILRTTSISP